MSEILNGWMLTLYKHVETWRDVYHSSDISQKTSPWQISVVMSAIAICWPKSWQNFNKRSAQIQKLSLRIQWGDVMRMCVVLSEGKQCKNLTANNNKLACFLDLLVKIIKIYHRSLFFSSLGSLVDCWLTGYYISPRWSYPPASIRHHFFIYSLCY